MTKKTEIPSHLKPFVSTQHYDQYTPVNHAVWRYIMRQNHSFKRRCSSSLCERTTIIWY